MKYVLIVYVCFSQLLLAKDIAIPLSTLQSQIKKCHPDIQFLSSIKTFQQLYAEIDKKYLLLSKKTIYREIYFQIKNERRKIKVTDGQLELFKVEEDERHTSIAIEARHTKVTLESKISQLILNAKIEKDWHKTVEKRENGLKIEIVRVDQVITQLNIFSNKKIPFLSCQIVNGSDVCLCN